MIVLAAVVVLSAGHFASASQLGVRTASLTTFQTWLGQPLGLLLKDAGKGSVGQPDREDVIQITFPAAIDAASLCSTWTNTSATQTLGPASAAVVITNGTIHDLLTVAPSCPTSHVGSIDLGDSGYVTSMTTFSQSAMVYEPSTRVLTITLSRQMSGAPSKVSTVRTAVYTPDPGLRWADGTSIAPLTASKTAVQF